MTVDAGRPKRPPTAQRIQAARQRAGLSHEVVASRVGLDLPSYYDLEAFDEEAFTVISLRQLCSLASVLGVSARALVGDDPAELPAVAPSAVVEQIRAGLGGDPPDVDAFSARVGWDVAAVLDDPEWIWDDWCVDALADICGAIGVHWLAVLADGLAPAAERQ